MPTEVTEHPGLKLTAVENADGTWNVLDVPILYPLPKGARFNADDIGEEWMRSAIRTAEVDARTGHLGSLSVGHHPDVDLGIRPEYAGKFLPRRVGMSDLEGQQVPSLFVDFLFVPASIVDRMERHELSYRSPEVVNWAKFRVDNVSLLSTEPPFWRGPMLGIGRRIRRTETPADTDTYSTPATFAAARFSDGAPPHYRFSEEFPMPDDTKKATAKCADGGSDGGEPKGTLDVGAVVKAIESGEIAVKDFDAILAAIAAKNTGGDAGGEMTDQQPPKAAGKPEPAMMRADTKVLAKLSALEDWKERVEQREATNARISAATRELEIEGIQVGEKTAARIAKFAAMGDDALGELVAELKENAQRDSEPSFAGVLSKARQIDPPEVAKFSAKGPDALRKARELNASYDRLVTSGHARHSREEFIEINMATVSEITGGR